MHFSTSFVFNLEVCIIFMIDSHSLLLVLYKLCVPFLCTIIIILLSNIFVTTTLVLVIMCIIIIHVHNVVLMVDLRICYQPI